MEKTNIEKSEELISLNEKLYSEFSVNELEERLETDPLILNTIFDWGIEPMCECKKIDCTPNCTYCYGGTYNDVCNCNSVDNLCPELSLCTHQKH